MDMFDPPQAKRIRRTDLNSDSASQASSEDDDNDGTTTFLRALSPRFAVDRVQPILTTSSNSMSHINEEDPEPKSQHNDDSTNQEIHAFRLFSNAASITLPNTHELGQSDAVLANKLRRIHRPENYWRADPSESARRNLQQATLSGEDIRRLATMRWPGCEVKWRVSVWPRHALKDVAGGNDIQTDEKEEQKKRRCRKSKKTRIKMRKQREEAAALRRRKQEEAQRAVEQAKEKEEYLRTKKTATNRKKQLKKREKERERKRMEGEGDE